MTCRNLAGVSVCKRVLPRANSQCFPDSPKVLLSVMLDCGGCGLPRRFAPRNDMQKLAGCLRLPEGTAGVLPETSLYTQERLRLLHSTAPNALATADTPLPSACHCKPRSCTRAHVLPSACHCEPVRTLVWQSVLFAVAHGRKQYPRQIRSRGQRPVFSGIFFSGGYQS